MVHLTGSIVMHDVQFICQGLHHRTWHVRACRLDTLPCRLVTQTYVRYGLTGILAPASLGGRQVAPPCHAVHAVLCRVLCHTMRSSSFLMLPSQLHRSYNTACRALTLQGLLLAAKSLLPAWRKPWGRPCALSAMLRCAWSLAAVRRLSSRETNCYRTLSNGAALAPHQSSQL